MRYPLNLQDSQAGEPWTYVSLSDFTNPRFQIGTYEGMATLSAAQGLSLSGAVWCVMDLENLSAFPCVSAVNDPTHFSVKVMSLSGGDPEYLNRYPMAPVWMQNGEW